ncbi:MAG: beta-N-acetylhexosaminidase [Bacteroidetes bacterium]|nr:MAG: beta-N-acetylhexosaminidase [Bacteroidota bacterium]
MESVNIPHLRFALLLLLMAFFSLSANRNNRFNFTRALDPHEAVWVDSVFNMLSEDERLGQLFMIRAHSDRGPEFEHEVEDVIRQYRVGGLCFFQGTPERQAELTNRYQALSDQLPLLVAMDAEWGLGMRLKESTISYPKQMMLGAIRDNRLIYEMGRDIARQCRRLGVHINFAPVADVNNNPENPVINDRSFGEDRNNVTAKCFQYMMGLQDGGVLACAKHFPGHGDTDVDSHLDLPVIPYDYNRLDSLELFPFRALSLYGVGGMMVAHLSVPALDPRPNRPTTLSQPVVQGLLRKKLGFEGLIMTDAMEMEGVAKYYQPGFADLEALRAGNDLILLSGDVGAAITAIKAALADGSLDREQVNESVRRVLRAKYRLGLTKPQRVQVEDIRRDLNLPEYNLLKRRLVENSLTLVRDRANVFGFPQLEKYRLATLALGDSNRTVFQTTCGFYAPMPHFNLGKEIDSLQAIHILDTLREHDIVLVSLHDMSRKPAIDFGLTASQRDLVRRLCAQNTVVLTVFGNPYSLKFFEDAHVILEAYNEDNMTQSAAAQALFGAVDLTGVLPVTVTPSVRYGQGLQKVFPSKRMGYDIPEAVGLSSDTLRLMDSLVAELIGIGAAPGCQVLVAREGKVVWHQAYGRQTYDSLSASVSLDNLYDLASITKVAASVVSVMRKVDEGVLDIKTPMSAYVPELLETDKKDLTVEAILAHHAGLKPWIPFYEKTLIGLGRPSPEVYHPVAMTCYEIPVAKNLYMADDYVDSIWHQIYASPLREDQSYKYSDLGLYLTARALEHLNGQPLDVFARRIFYRPLGLATTMFNPWKYGLDSLCVPTEEDNYFRQQRLQGYVHDMGAAMLGGVSGHAGLFSNANDLAKIFQMLLNKGLYGGRRYLKSETVTYFTTRYKDSTRRGIGFDMKELDPDKSQNVSSLAGPGTFGHTGFTGNSVWADPDENLIFIFLSNRTYPAMNNRKLIDGDYRPRLQSIVYRALMRD